MNSSIESACLRVACGAVPPQPRRPRAWRRKTRIARTLAFLFALLAPAAALGLVGPAREAPELEPYVVMVLDESADDPSYCSASVITRTIVLTAAHCVASPDDARVRFRDAQGELATRNVASIAINPGYRRDAIRRRLISIDLALIRLVEPLPSDFKQVALSTAARLDFSQTFRIAGFGVGDERSVGTGGVLRAGNLVATGPRSSILVWLTDPNRAGLGACTGDSGAPIFAADRPVLLAVAVWAKGEGGHFCGALTQAVLIAPQRAWIENVARAWGVAESARP